MNVLLIGSGGREHAIAWRLSKSRKVKKIFCCPGNAGIGKIAENINLKQNDFNALVGFVKNNSIDLTIIGPEATLAEGIVDRFKENGLLIFGPTKSAARIESSKAFAKELMKKYNIPTARYQTFNEDEYDKIKKYINSHPLPVVIKADGLAAGKGVIIAVDTKEADAAIDDIIKNKAFGSAGRKVVIEEFLSGDEASVFAITDGSNYITLPAAQDHKRIFDNDMGKNTGGMGAYAPTGLINKEILEDVKYNIIEPVLKGMTLEGCPFSGCLYCGLIITADGPKVIEFNCRFGDPETQAVLPLIKSDFFDLLFMSAKGDLSNYKPEFYESTAVCIVLASGGYPDKYETSKEIIGLEQFDKDDDKNIIFHAGTKENNGKILTAGGRVLSVTCLSTNNDLREAINKSYSAVKKISFEGMHFRNDIGKKGLKYI